MYIFCTIHTMPRLAIKEKLPIIKQFKFKVRIYLLYVMVAPQYKNDCFIARLERSTYRLVSEASHH